MEKSSFRMRITFITHAIVAVAIAWFLSYGFGESIIETGQSMEPTIEVGDKVIIDQVTYHFHLPERYDVVAFPNPENLEEYDIKRVIGLPGETVMIKDGRIYINGDILANREAYDRCTLAGLAAEPIVLSENEYFVLGDNRLASEDSRFDKMGNIKTSEILGKVWFRTDPISKIGKIR